MLFLKVLLKGLLLIACKVIKGVLMAIGEGGPSFLEFCDVILFISRGGEKFLN